MIKLCKTLLVLILCSIVLEHDNVDAQYVISPTDIGSLVVSLYDINKIHKINETTTI